MVAVEGAGSRHTENRAAHPAAAHHIAEGARHGRDEGGEEGLQLAQASLFQQQESERVDGGDERALPQLDHAVGQDVDGNGRPDDLLHTPHPPPRTRAKGHDVRGVDVEAKSMQGSRLEAVRWAAQRGRERLWLACRPQEP